jgi:hypothetical protein
VHVEIVAWDCVGHVLAARSTSHLFRADPTMTEAWATLHAVIYSKKACLFDILLDGDALQHMSRAKWICNI